MQSAAGASRERSLSGERAPHSHHALYGWGVRAVDDAASAPQLVPPCAVCEATRATPRFAVEGVASRLVVCEGCGTGRLHPLPDGDALRALYPPHYYGDLGRKFLPPIEFVVRWVGRRHASFLASGLPRGGRVLDVGCGRGLLLGALADRGFEAHGFEVSEAAAQGADPRAKIRVAARLEEAGYPDAHFDGAILWHVLEHVPDPRATLAAVRRLMRPGGRLVVAVPNFASAQARWAGPAWFHLDLPRHLWHFPLSALLRLLDATGFTVRSEHHFSLRQNPFGWVQSWQNRRPDLPRNGLYTLLYRRARDEPAPFDVRTRRRLLLGFAAAAAPALAATFAEAAARNGATVHVVATPR